MRKIAPLVLTSLVAFTGAAFAADNTGSPTVSPNTTNPVGQSYSDKSNTSTGTNATMDDKSKSMAVAEDEKKMAKKPMKKKHTMTKSHTMDTPMTSDTTMGTTTSTAPASTAPASTAPTATAPASTVAPIGNNNAATVNSTTGKSGQ